MTTEEEFPELCNFIAGWCNGGSNGRKMRISIDGSIEVKNQFGSYHSIGPKDNVGRNDSCPLCLEDGVKMKWKKCKMHNP